MITLPAVGALSLLSLAPLLTLARLSRFLSLTSRLRSRNRGIDLAATVTGTAVAVSVLRWRVREEFTTIVATWVHDHGLPATKLATLSAPSLRNVPVAHVA